MNALLKILYLLAAPAEILLEITNAPLVLLAGYTIGLLWAGLYAAVTPHITRAWIAGLVSLWCFVEIAVIVIKITAEGHR